MSYIRLGPDGSVLPDRITVGGIAIDPLNLIEIVNYVRDSLARGAGGRIAAVDTELARRVTDDPFARTVLDDSALVVAAGASIVWASRAGSGRGFARRGLPESIDGTRLLDALLSACAADGRRIYLLGGTPGEDGVPSGAARAAAILRLRHPGLRVAGWAGPTSASDPAPRGRLLANVVEAKPDLVIVASGFPEREGTIDMLRRALPGTWFYGFATAIDTIVGGNRHTPMWTKGVRELTLAAHLFARLLASRVLASRALSRR
jgi:N-acetylglucosaminyldiphosphoundecaprenol N-acetyl-beta-D-mannosaminyltransferase